MQARDAYGNALDEQVGDVTASIEWESYNTLTAQGSEPLELSEKPPTKLKMLEGKPGKSLESLK